MVQAEYFKMLSQVVRDLVPVPTVGILTVTLLSCVLFGIQTYFQVTSGLFSVGASVFLNGHIHRLFIYPFYHRTLAQLLSNITVLVFFSGSLEKGFGTVRFLLLFLQLSTSTGFLYSLLDLLQSDSSHTHTEGLLSVALACVALTTMHTKMTKGFLFGVSFPTMALPWVFLIITSALVPLSVLPCNIIAVLVGWMFGKGWFSFLDLTEARAGVLEKTTPFRFLRGISGNMFVPASTEERRKTLLPRINPTPGSYPVQAYAPRSSINSADTTAKFYTGWPDSASTLNSPAHPLHPYGHGPSHGFGINLGQVSAHSFGLSHGHGHSCNHDHSHSQM